MPRPKKTDETKRDNRLTLYLTDTEQSSLKDVSESQNRPMTQIVSEAVREWLLRLLEPPEGIRKARFEKIMREKSLQVRGYVCKREHVWWIDWTEPMLPKGCPMCGTEDYKSIWSGTVQKGL